MSIVLRGHILNQRQLDAITPVFNESLGGKLGRVEFEEKAVAALEQAGCPLGYDPGFRPGQPLEERIQNWRLNGQVGMSSRAIWAHMTGSWEETDNHYPHDTGDLNRCLLLLDLIPEWAPRMPEMANRGPQWAALVACWDELTASFLEEAGLDWSKGTSAPQTYQLMKAALGEA